MNNIPKGSYYRPQRSPPHARLCPPPPWRPFDRHRGVDIGDGRCLHPVAKAQLHREGGGGTAREDQSMAPAAHSTDEYKRRVGEVRAARRVSG